MAKITKRTVETAAPRDKEYYIWDEDIPGLGLRVLPSGRRQYIVQYRAGRRSRRMSLGPSTVLTTEQARSRALAILADARSGKDPAADREARRDALLVKDLAERFDKPLLEGGYYPGRKEEKALDFPPVKVDRTVKNGDTVTLGGTTITAHATPGHSPGCTSWSLNVMDGKTKRSVIVFCSASVALNRLVGSNATHPGIVDDYRKTFAWAKTAKFDVLLAPHPEMYGMQEKRAKIAAGASGQGSDTAVAQIGPTFLDRLPPLPRDRVAGVAAPVEVASARPWSSVTDVTVIPPGSMVFFDPEVAPTPGSYVQIGRAHV